MAYRFLNGNSNKSGFAVWNTAPSLKFLNSFFILNAKTFRSSQLIIFKYIPTQKFEVERDIPIFFAQNVNLSKSVV